MKKHTNGAGRNFGGRKRSIAEGSDGPPLTKKSSLIHLDAGFTWNLQALSKAAEAVSRGGKSPVSALNELGVKVSYSVRDHHGPAHCPHFTVAVTVANMTFEGYGTSKREARASAARSCLSTLLARVGQTLPVRTVDFSSDLAVGDSDFQSFDGTPMQQNTPRETPAYREPPPPPPAVPASIFAPKQPSPTHKSPINELYEKYPTVEFQITHGDGSALDTDRAKLPLNHSMRFKVVCKINEMSFEGYGSSKKQAKLAASRSALASLSWAAPAQRSDRDLPQYLADCVAKMVNEKFNELMKNDPVHLKRKVLAGIVMTVNNDPRHAKIIAVTTGTKCVSGDQMSVYGRAVNDCHAEVAARRCLQRYLYNQLLMYAESNDPRQPIPESDVEPVPDAAGGYRLKTDRQIHLYISTAPCGDGRIFSPHEEQLEPDRHPNRFSRGQLRTKIESGEGTIPVKNSSVIQTWDGVLQGSRLLTMSCSDKLARWGAAGLQGALLAALLQPVYLASLVLGSLLQRDHVHRALCGRFEKHLEALPPPYRLTAPMLARAASMESRTPARAPSFSVCWCATTPIPEIINAVTGKLENEQPSMLCKQAMFARWLHLVKRLPLLPQDPDVNIRPLPDNPDNLLYAEAKEMSTTYQVAKQRIMVAFTKAQLGSWVKKPIEQDQFYCEIRDANTSLLFSWAGHGTHDSIAQGTELGNDKQNYNDNGRHKQIDNEHGNNKQNYNHNGRHKQIDNEHGNGKQNYNDNGRNKQIDNKNETNKCNANYFYYKNYNNKQGDYVKNNAYNIDYHYSYQKEIGNVNENVKQNANDNDFQYSNRLQNNFKNKNSNVVFNYDREKKNNKVFNTLSVNKYYFPNINLNKQNAHENVSDSISKNIENDNDSNKENDQLNNALNKPKSFKINSDLNINEKDLCSNFKRLNIEKDSMEMSKNRSEFQVKSMSLLKRLEIHVFERVQKNPP